jgi:hypothetical protein
VFEIAEITVCKFQVIGWRGELSPPLAWRGSVRCRPRPRGLRTEERTCKPYAAIGTTSGAAFCSAMHKRTHYLGLQNSLFADRKLIPNPSVLALTDRTGALQNCMSLTPKRKHIPESGLGIQSNCFSLNNMAERVGFENTVQRTFNNMQGQR